MEEAVDPTAYLVITVWFEEEGAPRIRLLRSGGRSSPGEQVAYANSENQAFDIVREWLKSVIANAPSG
jgi:hypothetical protein